VPDQESGNPCRPSDPAEADLSKLIIEARAVILEFVPEAEPIIQEQQQYWEKESGIPLTLYEYVGYLAEILASSIEERDYGLTRRCLQAAEELLGKSSTYLQETIDDRIVDPFPDLLLEVREFFGPKMLALLEGKLS
jgi:hypothetical protein